MIWIAIAYFCGSIPFGLIFAKLFAGVDPRAVGSGNIGATNVARAAGRTLALMTLLFDAIKGFAPVVIAPAGGWLPAACAVVAVVGHCFPVWLLFRGGKGVATGLGVSFALAPWAALAGAAAWGVLYKMYKISSVGSLAGVGVSLAVAAFTASGYALAGLAAISALILFRHADNIRRLLHKQES